MGGGGGGPLPPWLGIKTKPFVIFSLALFKWQRVSATACQRWRPLKIHRRALGLFSPAPLTLLFPVGGRHPGKVKTTASPAAVLIPGGRKACRPSEHVLLLIWWRLLCGWAKDLVSHIEDKSWYLRAMDSGTPTSGLIFVHWIFCGVRKAKYENGLLSWR